jgi:sugar lactone lactonase YvrE
MTQGGSNLVVRASRACAVAMFILVFASAAWSENVLIMNGVSAPSGPLVQTRLNATNHLSALLTSAGHTVTVVSELPGDLSAYATIWDIDFAQAIAPEAQPRYVQHLGAGKRLYLIGENDSFGARNASMIAVYRLAGGGGLVFQNPAGDDDLVENGPQSIETVVSPFNGPNTVNSVTFAAPGGVTNGGSGQLVTFRASTKATGAGAAFGRLVVIFDVNFLEGVHDPAAADNLIRNLIAYLPPVAAGPEVAAIIPGVGRPFGVAIHQGFAYVADPSSHTVWKVSLVPPFDRVPVAGIGWKTGIDPQDFQGFNGDGIAATEAQLDNPSGVAIDPSGAGTLYIADTGNHAVRKVSLTGAGAVITTAAGIPTTSGVTDAAAFAACQNQCQATSLPLFGPRALALDGDGNLYIADRMNQQVKRVDAETHVITVVAGVAGETGGNDGPVIGAVSCAPGQEICILAAKLNSPVGLAIDGQGVVYIADEGNNRIRTVNDGTVGTLQAGALVRPTGVAVTSGGGAVYIADYGNHRIRRATDCAAEACTVENVAGTGTPGASGAPGAPATAAQLNSPISVTLDGDILYIADMVNGRIVAVDVTPTP